MGTNYRNFEDVLYVAGVTFQSEYGVHEAGSVVKEATKFQNLEVLVDNRFLYPIAPEHGYAYLPPHLYNHIGTEEEVMAKLAGVPMNNPEQYPDGKPEVVKQAEREAEQRQTEKTSKEAKANAAKAAEETAERAAGLATVDANPAYQDKSADLKKMYEGKTEAYEVMEDQVSDNKEQAEKAKDTAKAVSKESTGLVTKSGNQSKTTKTTKKES